MGNGEREQLIKRAGDLSLRAEKTGRSTWTEFLTLAERSLLQSSSFPVPPFFTGGYDAAERCIAVFSPEEDTGSFSSPVVCLRIAPVSARFSEALSHRDYLGALMHLGIRREVLGDIIAGDGEAWLFCLTGIAPYLTESLQKVRNTQVTVSQCKPPEVLSQPPEPMECVVASERLDALVSAVFRVSRSEAKALIENELVFLNGSAVSSPSRIPENGVIVSVRGYGRFQYEGIERETKKRKLRVSVRVYR